MRHVRSTCERGRAQGVCGEEGKLVPRKKQTVVIAEEPIDENALKEAIAATGYTALSVKSEPYQKKGLFHF